MPDEQVQAHEPAHDAIRQAQDELERRIEELRQLAAVDTGSGAGSSSTPEPAAPRADRASFQPQDPEFQPSQGNRERGRESWEDAVMRPVQPGGFAAPQQPATSGGFTPDPGQPGAAAGGSSATAGTRPAPRDSAPSPRTRATMPPAVTTGSNEPTIEETEFWAHTRTALRMLQQSTDELRHDLPDEMGRMRDEVTKELSTRLSSQVSSMVADQVERIVRDELSGPSVSMRQLQQQLPSIADRISQMVADELEAPAETIRQLQEELPAQLDRVERTVERLVHEDSEGIERAMGASLERMERSLRGQFERVETEMRVELERVSQTVREELEAPMGSIRQLQDEIPAQMERMERVVRESSPLDAVTRLAGVVTEQQRSLDESSQVLKRQRDEARQAQRDAQSAMRDEFASVRTSMRELLEQQVTSVMMDIATAGKVSLERLESMSDELRTDRVTRTGELEKDRLQRVEDLEMLVDTMTTGYQGIYSAVTKLSKRFASLEQRFDGLDEKFSVLPRLEEHVGESLTKVSTDFSEVRSELQQHLSGMQEHLSGLAPAPVVVTVNHPEAQVSQSTRGGYLPKEPTEG